MEDVIGWIFGGLIFGTLALIALAVILSSFCGLFVYLLRALVFVVCICGAVITVILHPIKGPKALLEGYREGKKNPYASPVSCLWDWP
jgi:hypothetical protein